MARVSSQSGFISVRLIILILPLVLLVMGGQGLYIALKNRQPASMTFAEYAAKRPDAKWLQLKDTKLDVVGSVYFTSVGKIKDVYIPLRAADEGDEDGKVIALLHTKDSGMIQLMEELKQLENNQKAAFEFALKNHERLFPVREVNGLLEIGIDSDDRKRSKIAKLSDELAKDFVVIEENKKPNLLLAIGLLVGGLVAMKFCWFRGSGTATPPPIPANLPPNLPPGLPPGTVVK